jgi:hypothetical protein
MFYSFVVSHVGLLSAADTIHSFHPFIEKVVKEKIIK